VAGIKYYLNVLVLVFAKFRF